MATKKRFPADQNQRINNYKFLNAICIENLDATFPFRDTGALCQTIMYFLLRRYKESGYQTTASKIFICDADSCFLPSTAGRTHILFVRHNIDLPAEYEECQMASRYLSDAVPESVKVYVDKQNDSAVIYTASSSKLSENFDRIAHIIFLLFPNIVSRDEVQDANSDAGKLIHALISCDYDAFYLIINRLLDEIEPTIDKDQIAKSFAIVANAAVDARIKKEEEAVRIASNRVEELNNSLQNAFKEAYTHKKELQMLLDNKTDPQCDETLKSMIDMFQGYDCLDLESVQPDGSIYYFITTRLEFYDPDIFERIAGNKSSWVWTYSFLAPLLIAIFKDEKYSINTVSRWRMEYPYSLKIVSHSRFGSKANNAMPHPHLDSYGCEGNNAGSINALLRDGNMLCAVEQSIASAKNLNFADSIVCRSFAQYLASNLDRKFIIDNETKEFLSAREAIFKLTGKEYGNGTTVQDIEDPIPF